MAFALILLGGALVFSVSKPLSSVEMQPLLWPLLVTVGLGLALYREVLVDKDDWNESTIERGGASHTTNEPADRIGRGFFCRRGIAVLDGPVRAEPDRSACLRHQSRSVVSPFAADFVATTCP